MSYHALQLVFELSVLEAKNKGVFSKSYYCYSINLFYNQRRPMVKLVD